MLGRVSGVEVWGCKEREGSLRDPDTQTTSTKPSTSLATSQNARYPSAWPIVPGVSFLLVRRLSTRFWIWLTPWSRYRISSLSLVPPGCSGRRRGWGRGDGWCEGFADEAGGVGRWAGSALAVEAMLVAWERAQFRLGELGFVVLGTAWIVGWISTC